jgi:hypothetical protein
MRTVAANRDTWISGDAWFICDRCSQRFRRSEMLVEWTNLRVDAKCLDPRPPQMQPPDVYPEGLPFYGARPPQDNPDRLQDDTSLQSITGGFSITPPGQLYPNGQQQQPGALSPQLILESNSTTPQDGEPNNPGIGTPIGPNVLADDVSIITGVVQAGWVPNSPGP